MTGSLLIPGSRIEELLANTPGLNRVTGAALVMVSGAKYVDPDGADRARFTAALKAADSSTRAGVPHLFMLDSASHRDVAGKLWKAGGIVVSVRHDEGGLARPYLTASTLIDAVYPAALMGKVEAEKDLCEYRENITTLLKAAEDFNVITGVRSQLTLDSMPDYLRLTEALLALATRDLTGTYDAASGVLALTARGRRVLRQTIDEEWQYLINVPFAARVSHRLSTGEAEIGFRYHEMVVREENGNESTYAKRRHQLQLMLDCAIATAGGMHSLTRAQLQTVASVRSALAALKRLSGIGI